MAKNLEASALRLAFTSISQGVIVTDAAQAIRFANPAFLDITGYAEADLIGVNCRLLQGPGTDRQDVERIRECLSRGERFSGVILNYRANGEQFCNDLSIDPLKDRDGQITGFVGVTRDVTSQRAAEEKIERMRGDYIELFQINSVGMVIHNSDGTILEMNDEARRLLTRSDDVIGTASTQENWFFTDDLGRRLPEADYPVNKVLSSGLELRNYIIGYKPAERPDTEVWFQCFGRMLVGRDGESGKVLISFLDITATKRLEIEARQSRERFELAASAAQEVIFEWDLQNGQFWANDNYALLFGTQPPANRRLIEDDAIHILEADRELYLDRLKGAIASGQTRVRLESRFLRPDKTIGTLRAHYLIQRDVKGNLVRLIGSKIDVSAEARIAQLMAEAELRFRTVANLVGDIIWDVDLTTGEYWISQDWERKLGIVARRRKFSDSFRELHVQDDDLIGDFEAALASGKSIWSCNYETKISGKSFAEVARIFRTDEGKPVRVIGCIEDVTEKVRTAQLDSDRQRLESLGRLTGGVAHDFNNQLMVILGNTEMLQMMDTSEDVQEMLEYIRGSSIRAAELTERLLIFSKERANNPSVLDMTALVADLSGLLRDGLSEDIALDVTGIPSKPLYCLVDEGQFQSALINIVVNSQEALSSTASPRIEISVKQTKIETDVGPLVFVDLCVTDNGLGMTPEVRRRAFEPFFSTKANAPSAGLGLSMVHGFVQQSGGQILIRSNKIGTSVTLRFPQLPDPGNSTRQMSFEGGVQKTVLLVEDEESVRQYVKIALLAMGLHVREAGSGKEALAILAEGEIVDLIFSDIVMPGGMNGYDLVEEARRLLPGLPALLMSGYSDGALDNADGSPGAVRVLGKPYSNASLRSAVIELIG